MVTASTPPMITWPRANVNASARSRGTCDSTILRLVCW